MSEENRPRVEIILHAERTPRSLQSTGLPGDNQATYIEKHEPTSRETPNFENEFKREKDDVTLVEKPEFRTMPAQTRSRGSGNQPPSHSGPENQEMNAAITESLRSWVEKYVEDRLTMERVRCNQEVELWRAQLSKHEEKEKKNAEKNTDDSIKSKWETMGYNIRNIVYMLRGYELMEEETVLWELQTRLPKLPFNDIHVEAKRDAFDSFLGAYIWKFVYIDILSGKGCQWRSNVVNFVQAAKRDIIGNEEDPERRAGLACWFSKGSEETASQVNPELQQTMIDMLIDSLLNMLQTRPSDRHIEQARCVITEIVHDATELAIMFMSSKALLIPDWPNYELFGRLWHIQELDTHVLAYSETEDWGMVVRPGLEKYGNADGEKHDISTVLCKPALIQVCRTQKMTVESTN